MAIRDIIDGNIVPNNNANYITGARLNTTLKAMVTDYEDKIEEIEVDAYTKEETDALIDAEEAARGAADTALQGSINAEALARTNADTALGGRVTAVESKIPAQASSANKLADKNFVNSSIATNTAYFKGTFKMTDEWIQVNRIQWALETSFEEQTMLGRLMGEDESRVMASCVSEDEEFAVKIDFNGETLATITAPDDDTYTLFSIVVEEATIHCRMKWRLVENEGVEMWEIFIDVKSADIANLAWDNIYDTLTGDSPASFERNITFFLGTYNELVSGVYYNAYAATPNDYLYVYAVNAGAGQYDRYKWTSDGDEEERFRWLYEFTLNNSSFTAAQWAAINSGATTEAINAIAGKYVKPASGIPESDLAAAVQTKLNKEEVFIATYGTTTYAEVAAAHNAGKICYTSPYGVECCYLVDADSVKVIFASISIDGKVIFATLPTNNRWSRGQITAQQVANLVTSISSASDNTHYPSAKAVFDFATTPIAAATTELAVDTMNNLGELSSAPTLTLAAAPADGKLHIYGARWSCGATPYTPTFPSGVKWVGGNAPACVANKTYEVSISDNLAVFGEF